MKRSLAGFTGTHNAKHAMSVLNEFITGFALLGRVVIIAIHGTLSSPNSPVSLVQVTMGKCIWEGLSANDRDISSAVSLVKNLPCLWIRLKNVVLSSVEPISNHYQHRLWYCSHSHKHHHGVAGSSGLAAMARTLLPSADYLSRSPPASFHCDGRYSYGI